MDTISSQLLIDKSNAVATISLNRGPANSYYYDYLKYLSKSISELSLDNDVKVILINSTSENFFCAGADIKIFSNNSVEENAQMVLAARELNKAIVTSEKIIISAVKGHVLGGGLEMIMACDIRLAAEGNYLIGLPEVKLGLMPGNGGTPRLIDLIGASRAMELLVTGDAISPKQAFDYGLFHKIFSKEEFENEVINYVKNLSKGAGEAMSAIKKYVQNHKGLGVEEALLIETESVNSLYNTSDAKEGFLAFVEKREPKFK
jgi:enoyl-CoA hydratase/carnithine racemase